MLLHPGAEFTLCLADVGGGLVLVGAAAALDGVDDRALLVLGQLVLSLAGQLRGQCAERLGDQLNSDLGRCSSFAAA